MNPVLTHGPGRCFIPANKCHKPQNDSLTGLLRDVSRSFYLTMRVLPGAIRPQIGLAYLLARHDRYHRRH